MRFHAALAVAALGVFGAPAYAQSVMADFSWPEMRAELVAAGAEITREDLTGDAPVLVGKDDTGLSFGVYGFQCADKQAYQRCTGADFISSFTLSDSASINDILDEINYAALSDYKGDDGRLKVSRYIIFDHGITRENLQVNISVFLELSNAIWDKLDQEKKLK